MRWEQYKYLVGEKTLPIFLLSKTIVFCPPLSEIYQEKDEIKIVECLMCSNKVIFSGILQKCILYLPGKLNNENLEAGIVRFVELEIPFTRYVQIPGLKSEDNCLVDAVITDCNILVPIIKDNNGNIITARQRVIIEVKVKITRNKRRINNFFITS
ncbi:DUF3794 domain-containing protein [Desulfolucanica intricata]|uniref:DUF3794 domain-containing protein n=1 Tax=Desulfolucanica intricata TaxID=1285191 RepID=UPI0008362EFF|nr:DUF3794 domain-containing protein [Desulfolucanica intricata]